MSTQTVITYGASCLFDGHRHSFLGLKSQDIVNLSLCICAWCLDNDMWQSARNITYVYQLFNTGKITEDEKRARLEAMIRVLGWREDRVETPVYEHPVWRQSIGPTDHEESETEIWWTQH